MISKNEIKFIRSLSLKKFRIQSGKFVAEGSKIVADLLSSSFKISTLYALENWIRSNSQLSQKADSVIAVSADELKKISSLTTPNQVLAIADIPKTTYDAEVSSQSMIIALDDIRDPGNLGTIIRIADWFGYRTIVCSESCVDAYNSKTVQASMGSIARVEIFYLDLKTVLKNSGLAVYGAFLDGRTVYDETFDKTGFLVIGNEANGISPEIEKLITHKIFIPAGNTFGMHAESLNASIATAVICSEIQRQSLKKGKRTE